jgi:glycosyltransferase involved in cell wall biosynthesis
MIEVHYALQVCDTASNQGFDRYCSDSKTEVIQKCVTSFFISIENCIKLQPNSKHTVIIFDDHSTEETINFLKKIVNKFNKNNLSVELIQLETRGIMTSIRACYEWMRDNGVDLVYQVQDDYLFEPNCIYEMIDVFMQIMNKTDTHAVVYPYNPPYWWELYEYRATPRTIISGRKRYWIQIYEVACTFMTSQKQLDAQWDIIEKFLQLDPKYPKLEAESLNYMLTKQGILAITPIESQALHMQSISEKDPYIDWKKRWDSVPNLFSDN